MLATRISAFLLCLAAFTSTYCAFAGSVLVEHLKFDTNPAPDVTPAKITATLYLPQSDKPVPAMVIVNSSGGVLDQIGRAHV